MAKFDTENVIIVPPAGRAEEGTPDPEPVEPPDAMANYPFVTCGFAIGNGSTRRTVEPSKTNFAIKNWAVHQCIWFSAEHYRRTRHEEWQQMYAINPKQIHVPHVDIHGVEFDPPNPSGPFWFAENLVHADNTNFDDWIATDLLNRGEYPGGPFTSMQSFHHHLSYRWDTHEHIHTEMATGIWEQFTNFNDPRTYAEGGANVARDFQFGIMQDTLAQNASNGIQWFPELETTITGVVNNNEIQIGTWSVANGTGVSDASDHFSGVPDGPGYTPNSHELQVIVMKANHSNSYSDDITGHKVINGSTDQIRIDGTANFTPSVGDRLWVKIRQFQVQPTDRTSSQWDDDLYHIRTVFFLEEFSRLNNENYGIQTGIYSNQCSQNFNVKQQGGATAAAMPVTLWQGKWDGLHWEHADQRMGFTGDAAEIGYWVKNTGGHERNSQDYKPDDLPKAIAANRPLLKENIISGTRYPCIWWCIENVRKENWNTGEQDVIDRYAFLTELDAGYVRFWSLFCWCMENVAAQPEMGTHSDPVTIDEELIEAGDPITPRDFWENWDTTGDSGRGSYDWKTPDFGTHGYFFEFENCMIQINLRVPTDINIAWIPSHMDGGQPIDPELDRGILPYAGDGFKWQAFNRATYVNNDPGSQHYGKTPSDYDSVYIMKDAELNNGKDRDVYWDCGACEAVIHMRVPTTNNPVTVDTTNNRFFYYKEKPIQMFGHQHIRINVDQATDKDMPAVMGSEASPEPGNLELYMDIIANRGFNHIRLWPYFSSDSANAVSEIASPLPWTRTGPGVASDGGQRFNLTLFNQEYFDRVEQICQEAFERDIIITILVWDVYGFQGGRAPWNPWTNNGPEANNVNSVEANANDNSRGLDAMMEGTIPGNIKLLQVMYEQKLIDTVNQFPNVIYEVNNEQGRLPFQTEVMDRIRTYELTKPVQHLVALSAGGLLDNGNYTQTDVGKTAVMGTTCDFIMPGTNKFGATWGDTDDSSGSGPPRQADTSRPWIMDMDHIEPHARRVDHYWKSLCRGYGYNNFESNTPADPLLPTPYSALYWEAYMTDTVYGFNIMRRNIGAGQHWLNNQTKNAALMIPTSDTSVASTTYALADPGEDYIVYTKTDSAPTIYQLLDGETYRVKWWNATTGAADPGTTTFTAVSDSQVLSVPFTLGADGAAVHVWRIS